MTTTGPRLDHRPHAPTALRALIAYDHAAHQNLDPILLELVKTRVSQINGCAFCVDMHTRDARKLGETEQRLYTLSVWHETQLFTPRERAALAWAEALTRLPDGVSDELLAATRAEFSDPELVQLTHAIITINSWNRLGVAFRPAIEPRP